MKYDPTPVQYFLDYPSLDLPSLDYPAVAMLKIYYYPSWYEDFNFISARPQRTVQIVRKTSPNYPSK